MSTNLPFPIRSRMSILLENKHLQSQTPDSHFTPSNAIIPLLNWLLWFPWALRIDAMTKNLDIINAAVSLIIKTERVIKTLKYEWLKRVPIIKSFDHLTLLCKEFESWYNSRRPHMTLDGFRPDDVYYDKKPKHRKSPSICQYQTMHSFILTKLIFPRVFVH